MTLSKVEAGCYGEGLDNYMESGKAEDHQQDDEYPLQLQKVSSFDNKYGEGHIK